MSLWKLRSALLERTGPSAAAHYRVPRVWQGGLSGVEDVDPYAYYAHAVDALLARPAQPLHKPKGWTASAAIYNLFVRPAAAFDHDGDGVLGGSERDVTLNRAGVRETGTFLKAIAMLPHIARLGVDTVYLLPITALGSANRKGDLGSPYGIRNPMALDDRLADPLVPQLTVEEQFAAFCEAAHRMGLKVVLEFVFRTAAQDADWAKEHPDWFYWIRADAQDRSSANPAGYGNPPFTPEEMKLIRLAGEEPGGGVRTPAQVAAALKRGQGKLVEPPESYQRLFTATPHKVEKDARGAWVGTVAGGQKVRIPGAFADWPPDDVQPPWSDVTYLRMYGAAGERFNYVAYNTLRLYDPALATPRKANKPLWNAIASVVPYYQQTFGIDGVMIDMGHALPLPLAKEIQKRARARDKAFAFWEEKFFCDPESPKTGYEAVVGPGIFTLGGPDRAAAFLRELQPPPVRFFGTAENHNTPRLAARPAGSAWARAAWALGLFLPGALPFVHNGLEVLERTPLNTGLDFTKDDLKALEGTPLGLFSRAAFTWESGGEEMIPFLGATLAIRRRFADLCSRTGAKDYRVPEGLPANVLGYERLEGKKARLAVLYNATKDEHASVAQSRASRDLLSGASFQGAVDLGPQELRILEFLDER